MTMPEEKSASFKFLEACGTCPIACTQPFGETIKTVDGVFIREMNIPDNFTIVAQHIHKHDHTTMVAVGRVKVWIEGVLLGDYTAPSSIFIAADTPHMFQSQEPNTLLYCIHNLHGADEVDSKEQV